MENSESSGFHSQFGRNSIGNLVSKISWHARLKMYSFFARDFLNCKNVLDVGVTSENVAMEANFFEELFPFKEKITAVGVEDAGHLEKKYKGLKFIKVKEGEKLPFADREFEVAFSNAVIEHIVAEEDRIYFVKELLRVSKSVFLTTPNKFFPVEAHTGVPFLHFCSPRFFNYLMNKKIISRFYNTSNLRPLSFQELSGLAKKFNVRYEIFPIYVFGFVSNWVLIFKQDE